MSMALIPMTRICALLRNRVPYVCNNLGITLNSIQLVDNEAYNQILQILNSVWDTGLGVAILRCIPWYRNDYCLETIHHVKTTPVLFLWMTVTALVPYNVPDAAYAIGFHIPSVQQFHALDLAYVLARFMDRYIWAGNYNRFNIQSFSFKLDTDGTYGLLRFDRKLWTGPALDMAPQLHKSTEQANNFQFEAAHGVQLLIFHAELF
ncbi:hypothetical protein DFH07DRAFT_768680 [Mycena maculata]|uniref:Uncharacterized protein n=1 Tax=Mycena maculata TaxID=230809 RepID=A0AAD7NPD5_9AGAR|nr:hypothetical protein DFH07DRAFT_768680 [Mycena maculata]